MVTAKTKAVIDEAEALLAAIRGSVLVHVQDGVLPVHLAAPLDSARSLNECISEIGDEGVCAAADTLEAWLAMLAAEEGPISHTRTRSLLDQISEVDVALIAYKSNSHAGSLDVADFVDESFKSIYAKTPAQAEPSPEAVEPRAALEIDPEVLEVFSDEADSLLETIQLNLEKLAGDPSNRAALWEIKKSSHTLKGASGIVGLRKLSQLAHRIEDLLERLSETNSIITAEFVNLVLETADCLRLLSAGEGSALDPRINALHNRFDKALDVISVSASASDGTSNHPAMPQVRDAKLIAPARSNSIVRVSLDRLDDLVLNMHDLLATRAAFERRFSEFEKQINETSNNTLRLQAASRKVEFLQSESTGEVDGEPKIDLRQSAYELAETARDANVINSALDDVRTSLEGIYHEQCTLISEIEGRLMRLRNVEFGTIANRLQRTVRVTCDEEGKSAEVVIENGSLEIDTQVIDSLIEPLLHLLKNAVVHGIELPETRRMLGKPELGRITVRVSNKGSYIVVSVTDDGRGIAFRPLLDKAVASNLISQADAEQMTADRIRELIFLPGLTTAEKLSLNAGRGVGMSIVRESIAAKGGIVLIETWPQKGTTFSIRLPRPFAERDRLATATDGDAASDITEPTTVLIVDDSPSVRLMTSKVIERAGWAAETAKDGIEALEKLHTSLSRPAVILSDIEMPRMGGYELVAALREEDHLKDIPVVFISSRTTERDKASAAGVTEYLTKPYDERKLVELIMQLAARPELVAC